MRTEIKQKLRKWFGCLFVIYLCGFAAFVAYDYIVNEPKTKLILTRLEKEFNQIQALPQAKTIKVNRSHKPRQALVGGTYSTTLDFGEIRKYYDKELEEHGWHFINEEAVRDWGRDFGGRIAHYRKSDYTASLQYAGDPKEYGWAYGLDLTWRLSFRESLAWDGR